MIQLLDDVRDGCGGKQSRLYESQSYHPQLSEAEMPDLPQVGEELFLFLQTLGQMQPGENGALAFAKTLSGATPDSFAEALKRMSILLFLALREEGHWSARKARRFCGLFEATARGEYSRLRNASGKTKAGTG